MRVLNATKYTISLLNEKHILLPISPGQLSESFTGSRHMIMVAMSVGSPKEIGIICDSSDEFNIAKTVINALHYCYSTEKEAKDKLIDKNIDYSKKLSTNEDFTESNKQYDFFISHASEDKDDIVRNLVAELKNNGFKIWYDEFELKIGDSIRKKIDYCLSNSKYWILIISHSFMEKYWTKYEFDSMMAISMDRNNVILPIWHKVTKDDVLKFSPLLTDKFALNTSLYTIAEIVKHLKNL